MVTCIEILAKKMSCENSPKPLNKFNQSRFEIQRKILWNNFLFKRFCLFV